MVEIAVSTAAVLLFVGLILVIGAVDGGGATLSARGALALVASIVLFVLVMTGIGYVIGGR